jgi:hypothetical protein
MPDQEHGKNVGYGNPPEHSRFVKGQSGNPKGRPKGSKNLSTILQSVYQQRVTVAINGRTIRMTKLEACVHQLANKAASGDLKAIREFFYWCRSLEEPRQEAWSASNIDEKDKPVMASLLRRLGLTPDPGEEPEQPQPPTESKGAIHDLQG